MRDRPSSGGTSTKVRARCSNMRCRGLIYPHLQIIDARSFRLTTLSGSAAFIHVDQLGAVERESDIRRFRHVLGSVT